MSVERVIVIEGRAGNGNVHLFIKPHEGSGYRVSFCGLETHSHRVNTWTNHKAKRCEKCAALAGALAANGVELRS